ncbi:BspA family leucine-rich repeat surface protein [Paraglaciecola arctica]|uniref:Fibronectin type-III domain-containing protein n=1 Tax=Paraglaciecola arctica BSs20135 TaxID=493475 RepID=K6XIJ5_9ALTE|nr:BspA family leucine-rich repeat surface protein [Paraglaciecola arctica]GAC20474.1 hypothetical protein GARC_3520 [Paraglaciecola arctica BSs20135]
MNLAQRCFLLSLVSLLLSSCGGGVSGTSETPKTPVNPEPSTTYFSVSTQVSSGGSISPTSIEVEKDKTTSFTISPDDNYVVDSVIGCNGSLSGTTYTTGALSSACSITANFVYVNQAPIVNAGDDQSVDEQTAVTLSGSATDSDGSIVSYQWSQTSGTNVVLNNTENPIATFTAPALTEATILNFELTITDNAGAKVTDSVTVTVTPVIGGVAQLGLISGGSVRLLDAESFELIAETTTSSNLDNYGYFSFSGLSIDDNDFYVLEVSNGVDTDPDDDGVIVEDEKVNNQGSFYTILTGEQLKLDVSRVTLLTEMLYTIAFDDSLNSDFSNLSSRLNELSETWLSDLNQDGSVDYIDALAFNPLQDQNRITLNYQQLLDSYVTAIYENKPKSERLKRLNFVFDNEIVVNGGNYQIIPFELEVSTNQLPSGITTEWFIDGEASDLSQGLQIQKSGINELTAKLFYQGEIVGEIKDKLYAVETQLAIEQETSQDVDTVIDLSPVFNSGSVVIPSGATTGNLKVQVNKVESGIVPVEQVAVSMPLVLGPAGTVFNKPVTISMPYQSDNSVEKLRIARYSADGEKDYLLPIYIDTNKSLVYFETDHFTTFVVEKYDDCYRQSCKKLALHLQKIKELMANHYKGDAGVSMWDDERWERVLNQKLYSQSENTIYDHFLGINQTITLSQVLAGTFIDAEHPNGINNDAKYLTAYNYLYPNDQVIKQAQERWNDVKKGLNAIKFIPGAALGTAAKLVSGKFLAAALTAIGLPTSKSEVIEYGVGKLLPVYNPVEIGDALVKAANDIALNKQMELYFSLREGLGIADGQRAEYSHFENAGYISDDGWLSSSYSSIPDINAKDFFNNIEDMYQYSNRYKKAHQEAKNYTPYNQYCTEQDCAEIENLTPEAAFAAMVITAYEQDELDENPYFFVESYQINDRELNVGKIDDRFDPPILIEGASGEKLTLNLNFEVVGNEEFLSQFAPSFSISSHDYSIWDLQSDDLHGLEYQVLNVINNGGGKATIEFELTLPPKLGSFQYYSVFNYEGKLSTAMTVNVQSPETNYYPPLAPNELVIEPGDGYVGLQWDCLQEDVLAYTIYYRTTGFSNRTNVNALSNECGAKQKVILGLSNGTEYYFSVSATNAKGEGDPSVEITATPQPNPPKGLSATVGDGEVLLSWNALPNATSYNLYYAKESFGLVTTLEYATKIQSISETSYTINNLTNGYRYYFVVSANNTMAESAIGDEVSIVPKPDGVKPQKPSGLTATMGITDAIIQWDEDSNASGYSLFYSTQSFGDDPTSTINSATGLTLGSVSQTTITELNPDGTMDYIASSNNISQVTVTQLNPGTQYYFALGASNRVGSSTFSNEIAGTTVTELAIPATLTGISVVPGESFINLSWDAAPSATSYTLYYSTTGGLLDNVVTVTNITATNYQMTNLDSDTTYYMSLTASNAVGESTGSYEVSTTIKEAENAQVTFSSLYPLNAVASTSSVLFTITGENLPSTLVAALEDSDSCSDVDWVNNTTATITCGIPDTNKQQLVFSIKNKPEVEGGSVISGAESLMINVSANNGNSFIQPCRDCGYSGAFDRDWHGDNTTHLAKDYPAFVGDNVLAMARGQVVKVLTNAAGFGGATPSLPGGAIVVMHTKANGDNFHALYGHVNATDGLAAEDIVLAGEILGTVGHYFVGTENGQEDWPHLHFGIWDAESDFPTVNLGYGTDRSFVNPVPFLINNQPEMLTELYSVSPTSAIAGKSTSFTVSGSSIPNSIAMSLAGSQMCSSVYDVTTTGATVDCTPNTTGLQHFYVKNKSGGVFLRGSENMQIDVQVVPQNNVVLGITFADQHFATCVQEHVNAQASATLADLTSLICSNRNITDVGELSYMTGLTDLDLSNNPIVEVNLDANQSLGAANLLKTNLSQASLEYLDTVTWITNLSYFKSPHTDNKDAFITTWFIQAGQTITLSTNSNYLYNYSVDWGDGNYNSNQSANTSHSYEQSGVISLKLTGEFPQFQYLCGNEETQNALLSIDQWGNNKWKSLENLFSFCKNLVLEATDTPILSDVSNMTYMFSNAESFNGDLSNWDVSNITNMYGMFERATSFNGDISQWDVSNVTDMGSMFHFASAFNGDLSNWNVSNVERMITMFARAYSFSGDLSNWDVSNVWDMRYMFHDAQNFNSDLSRWDVSNVIYISKMFLSAINFNSELSNWNVSKVVDMQQMFHGVSKFDSDLSNWNVSNVTNMSKMFYGASSFNSDLSGWDISNVTDVSDMFHRASSFNSDLVNWDVSNITNMYSMFYAASSFSGDISLWDVGNVKDMSFMFSLASVFNSNISNWDTSQVTKMFGMFAGASNFNGDISNWDVSNITTMQGMFSNASNFKANISRWDVSKVANMSQMFYEAAEFDIDISQWDVSNVVDHSDFSLRAGALIEPIWP